MNIHEQKIEVLPIRTQVANILRNKIFYGLLKPGEEIRQESISAELGVSRTPVREALQQLASEGLLVMPPHRGAYVLPITAKYLRDFFFVRAIMEGEAAYRFAGRITDEDAAFLRALHREESARFDALDIDGLRYYNAEMRKYIWHHCGNSRLEKTLLQYWHMSVSRAVRTEGNPLLKNSLNAHKELIELLISGDAAAARNFARTRVVETGNRVAAQYLSACDGTEAAACPPSSASPQLELLPVRTRVANLLRQRIFNGMIPRGTELRQEAVSAELGVSRTPVREAFQLLANEGLLEMPPHKGAFVAEITSNYILEFYEMKALFESEATYLFCMRIDRGDQDFLRQLNLREQDCYRQNDIPGLRECNASLHKYIWHRCNNSRLEKMLLQYWDNSLPRAIPFENNRYIERVQHIHTELVQALCSGDAEASRNLMRQHVLESGGRGLDTFLGKREGENA